MTTIRQIERNWVGKQFDRLLKELCAGRVEASMDLHIGLRLIPAASAMAMIRLDELGQAYVPLYPKLLRTLLNTQEADGGWSDPMTTALCVRALMLSDGSGEAIDRGLDYLVNLQKENGAWPAEPIRRLAADAPTTAFVLYQLGDQPAFRDRVRFDQAVAFLQDQERAGDTDTRALCHRATARCRLGGMQAAGNQFLWS